MSAVGGKRNPAAATPTISRSDLADADAPADDGGIRPERRRPERVAEHDHRRGALSCIAGLDEAAGDRLHAERLEQSGARLERRREERIAVGGHRRREVPERRHRLDALLPRRQIDVVADGDELLRDARAIVAMTEDDEIVGVRIRQRPQQDGLDDGEDRGVGADAQRQRQNGGDREERLSAEQTNTVPQVVEHAHHTFLSRPLVTAVRVEWIGSKGLQAGEPALQQQPGHREAEAQSRPGGTLCQSFDAEVLHRGIEELAPQPVGQQASDTERRLLIRHRTSAAGRQHPHGRRTRASLPTAASRPA